MPIKRPVSHEIPTPSRPPIERELFDLQPMIDSVIGQFVEVAPRLRPGELVPWAGDLRVHHEPALRRMFFGTLEWPRASGSPRTPTLSAALALVHARKQAFLDGEGGFAWFTLIEAPYAIQPTLVDGPPDEAMLRVSYCGVLTADDPEQLLRVRGAPDVSWFTPDGRPIESGRAVPPAFALDPAQPVHFLPPCRIELS